MTNHQMSWEQAVDWLRAQPELTELTRAAYLDLPVIVAAKRYHASEEWRAVRGFLPSKPGRALDLGAGNGILSYALAADGWTVTAVEPDPSDSVGANAIRSLVRETGLAINVVEAFGEAIPIAEANFDVVVARQVLHHAADLKAFCREMARLVRPGGSVITLRDHVVDGTDSLASFLQSHPLHHLYGGENAFSLTEYRSALTESGLKILEEIGSFDSVINYAPLTRTDINAAVIARLPWLTRIPARAFFAVAPFALVARTLSRLDRRPGRLSSFVLRRPSV